MGIKLKKERKKKKMIQKLKEAYYNDTGLILNKKQVENLIEYIADLDTTCLLLHEYLEQKNDYICSLENYNNWLNEWCISLRNDKARNDKKGCE